MLGKIRTFASFVKFSHTVFALPFALVSMVLASQVVDFRWTVFLWVILAMTGARSAAMAFNRILDREIDSLNPRTQDRELPSGKLTLFQAWFFVVLSSVLLVVSSFMLNRLCFYLSPLALLAILFYSYTKRFTCYSHFFLGVALGIAPVGAWLAMTGSFAWTPVILSTAVIFWVAGFDVIYSCQDIAFDKSHKLNSIPVRFGVRRALFLSAFFHIITVVFLGLIYFLCDLGYFYLAGLLIVSAILLYEHIIIKPSDLSRINKAFFDLNGYVSVVFFIFSAVDVAF